MPYFPYNRDGQAKYAPQSKGQFLVNIDKNQLFNIPNDRDGEYHIRILPPWSPEGAFAISSDTHYNLGVPPTTFRCPNVTQPGTCKFCSKAAQLRSEYDKYKVDITEISVKKRFYSNVINLDNLQAGVLVFPYGVTIYNCIERFQQSGNYGDITHPDLGHNITIYRTKQGKKTNDVVLPDPKPSKLANPAWLDQLHNLDIILPEPDVDLANKAFLSHPFKVYQPSKETNVQTEAVPFDTKSDDNIPDFKLHKGGIEESKLKMLEEMMKKGRQ